MKEAILYEKLKNKNVRCQVCQRRCVISPGQTGYCQTRINQDGKLYSSIYEIASAIHNDPIEKKPVFHYQPGSMALSLGTYGCNFKCLFCFHPDTNIATEKGMLPIKKIFKIARNSKVAPRVVTHTGKLLKIKKAFNHRWEGEILKIKPYYTPQLQCTPSHEIFAILDPASGKIEKIKATELTLKHYLLIPKNLSFSHNVTLDLKKILSPWVGEYKKNRKTSFEDILNILKMSRNGVSSKKIGNYLDLHPAYVRTLRTRLKRKGFTQKSILFEENSLVENRQKIKFKTEKKPFVPRFIKLDQNLAKLLGYYCAEGWVNQLKSRPNSFSLSFAFGKIEEKYFQEVKQLLSVVFGISPYIYQRKATTTLELGKTSIALFFKTLCGSGTSEKQVPEIINLAPKPVAESFLEGYVNGDGWIRNNEVAINTTSKSLALGIYWLVLKCGFLPRYYVWHPKPRKKIGDRVVKQNPLFYVKWKTKIKRRPRFPQRSVKFKENKDYYFVPIAKIEKEKYNGPVYNLEVEKEHSYLANFIGVGNCQNWEISWADGVAEAEHGTKLSPKEAIELAKRHRSAGIAITYNEPAIWLEYSLDVFKMAKNLRELYTCWVTNGYATKETIDVIAPYLDIYRVDLKSFDDKFYQKLINVPEAAPIFAMTKYVKDKYPQIHLECITNIIPTWNDSDKTLKEIAKWIKKELGPKTPWHVTRFFPDAKLTDVPPTPPETLFKARKIGLKEGLKFVYIGNLAVDEEDDTFCPQCKALCIERMGYSTKIRAVDKKGRCKKCGENLNIIL